MNSIITPNNLTLLRILSIPLIIWLLAHDQPWSNELGWFVFFIACMTDYWDGLLARRNNQVSRLGQLLDPVADKMLVMSCLVQLVAMGRVGVAPVVLILMREFLITGLRAVASAEGRVIAAETGAKYKTILQMLGTGGLMLIHDPYGLPATFLAPILLWIATAWTVWTGARYFIGFMNTAPKAQ